MVKLRQIWHQRQRRPDYPRAINIHSYYVSLVPFPMHGRDVEREDLLI
jgi:hypothetical protein